MESVNFGIWRFQGNKTYQLASSMNLRGVLTDLAQNVNADDPRTVIPFCTGDPSLFPCFRTTPIAEDAMVEAVRSAKYNSYAPMVGILPARRAVADNLSEGLPFKLSPDDIYITLGARQAIEVVTAILARPGANILVSKPWYPCFRTYSAHSGLEVRYFNLLPEKNWEVDFESVEAVADENTAAIVIINPGNLGYVYSYDHLKVADTARKLGILVISDEVYAHFVFGNTPYVSMGVFGSIVPVITLGSVSKRWAVPGWRLGWVATIDPNGILKETGVIEALLDYLNITQDPPTFTQAALPYMIEKTKEDFYSKILGVLREQCDFCYNGVKDIPCFFCPNKPQSSMFLLVKLNLSLLEDISDDVDFCHKLVREESVKVLPGSVLGMKDWIRITFAIELPLIEEGVQRLKAFCQRHSKKK